ncbi:MAG: hypothetical protein H8E82_00760 [Candidatus Marinimicrobia bacterium]|nr:hypothetical protein [Candidatus Neomarinimicrobiota bacterium]
MMNTNEQEYNPQLKRVVLEVVENQIRKKTPPETEQTLNRLMDDGYSRERAVKMIASVVMMEIWDVLGDESNFDEKKFVKQLKKLK